jgi:hypothetical protein
VSLERHKPGRELLHVHKPLRNAGAEVRPRGQNELVDWKESTREMTRPPDSQVPSGAGQPTTEKRDDKVFKCPQEGEANLWAALVPELAGQKPSAPADHPLPFSRPRPIPIGHTVMSQPIADATNVSPGRAGTEPLRIMAQPCGSFADHLDLAFDRGDRFGVGPERLKVMPSTNDSIASMPATILRSDEEGSLKGKHSFAADGVFQGCGWGNLNRHAQYLGQPVFERHPVKQRVLASSVKVSDEVHIRSV